MSLTIKHRVSLDLSLTSVQATIPFRKGDKGAHEVIFSLRNGTTNVELPPGTIATIAVLNGADDGKGVNDMCTVDHINHRIIYIPTVAALSVAGNVACELTVVGTNGEVLGAPRIHFFVDESMTDVTEEEITEALKASGSWDVIQKTAMNAKDAAQSKVDAQKWANGTDVTSDDPQYQKNAKYYAQKAGSSADEAQKWANGEGTVEGNDQYQKNAKYYAEEAEKQKNVAAQLVVDARKWADGENAVSGNQQYKNNAKYHAEQSKRWANGEGTVEGDDQYEKNAKYYADEAQKWANGEGTVEGDDQYLKNAKHYSTLSQTYAGEASNYAEQVGNGAKKIEASINPSNYELTLRLLSAVDKELSSKTIALPLQELITEIAYDNEEKDLIFTLRNGKTLEVELDAILTGLVTTTTLDDELKGKVNKLADKLRLYGTNSAGEQTSYFIADDIGDDTQSIMTQAAVAAVLNDLSNKLSTRIETNKNNIAKNTEDIAFNTERINALEKGGGGSGESAEFVEKEDLYSKKETDEYEYVQIATLPIDAFSLRTGTARGDTALIEVKPSGTYVLSFDSCIEHSGSGSLYLNEYTEDEEQVRIDARLEFERIGTGLGYASALIASLFPNGGRCTITVGATTKYIKLMFDAYADAPERLPSGLTLTYKSPILGYGCIKPDKVDAYTKEATDVKLEAIRNEIFSITNEEPELTAATKTGAYWIGTDGIPTDSESWYAFAYNRGEIVKIKSALLSVHFLETTTKLAFAFYNSETISADTFIGGHLFSEGTATSTENVYHFGELSIPDDCVTMVVCNRQASLSSPSVIFAKRALSQETEANVRKVVNDEVEQMASAEDASRTDFKYYGLPISLKQAKYKKVGGFSVIYDNGSEIGLNGAINGGAVYNNYFFLAGGGGLFAVYDLATKRYISKFYIAEHENIAPHANTVCFGNELYSETDEFPLLYVNAYQEDLPRGTCYALRIQRDGTTFSANIVQTISIGFTDTELWLCKGEAKVYGNFAIDTDNGYLYAYMPRTPEHTYRFFRFNLPTLSEGENVTLQDDDIIKYFDVSQMIPTLDGISYPQDGIYHQGKIYMLDCTASTIGRRCILVVNTSSEQTESVIDTISLGYTGEVEFIAVYNGCMVLGTVSADIIDFD